MHRTDSLRENLSNFHGFIGNYPRFEKGRQNDAGEAVGTLLEYVKNADGNSWYLDKKSCSFCSDPIGPQNPTKGLTHNLTPKATVKEMISSETQVLDPEYIHHCQDNLGNKAKAVPIIETRKIVDAGDFLVISSARDPRNPIETYPTEVLTINDKKYVIRSAINHHGATPKSGHYTASVFSNNRWYYVDDYEIIREMSGPTPYPKLSTFYFYEKMEENEIEPIPVKDAEFLPPSVRQPRKVINASRSSKASVKIQGLDVDFEKVSEEIKEIHRQGIQNLNNDVSNSSNLTPDNPALKQGMVMMENLEQNYKRPTDPCVICHESWFSNFEINQRNGMCHRCEGLAKKGLYTFGESNQMVPCEIPQCLKDLTYIEECCIKLAQPVFNIYCRQGGKTGLVGMQHFYNILLTT